MPDFYPDQSQGTDIRGLRHGKLKIFLGYAPGVGKTSAMLKAAWQRRQEGVDVVAAVVDALGYDEGHAWLEKPVKIPFLQTEHPDRSAVEMDVDAVLQRRPQLALVDKLAHTNPPGMRHAARYQDVEEMLAAGIDVYATLDIQHLESLRDVVLQITGIAVHETLPDRILDQADEIELVDLPPEELLRRFREGKVSATAPSTFFRLGNLTALRELAMRRAARRVDEQMRAYMQTRAILGPWAAAERLLALVYAESPADQVVRATRRLADQLHAEWFVLYVETAEHARLSEANQDRVSRALRLAEELGGKVDSLPGTSIVETMISYARKHNITKIVLGRSPRRHGWLPGSSLIEQVVRTSGAIDVQIVGQTARDNTTKPLLHWLLRRRWHYYFLSLALVFGATLLSAAIHAYISTVNLVMIYLLVVVVAAIYLGRGPAVLASIVSVLAFDFFFVPPGLTLMVKDTEYMITFLGLLLVGLVISSLAAQVRNRVESLQQRELETAALYALSRELAAVEGLDDIVKAVVDNVGQTLNRQVAVMLPAPGADSGLAAHPHSAAFSGDPYQAEAAAWVFQHRRSAGRGTQTFSHAGAYYLPLKTARGMVGVLGVMSEPADRFLAAGQSRLLEALASQAALAIERAQLAEAAQNAQLLAATEKLQSALLNSISHDLRTPLVSITGVLSSLEDHDVPLDEPTQQTLIETAREEAERLNRLVGNLLNMTRIESGAMRVVWELEDIQDVIGSALQQLGARIEGRSVVIQVDPDLPFVSLDFVLIVQALVNVIENAVKYSLPGMPIEIRARSTGAEVEIEVADRGIGIPAEDLERVFDKFYRVHRPDNVSGTGLGLSISKGFVEAHGGRIWARNRPGGGTCVTLALPEVHIHGQG